MSQINNFFNTTRTQENTIEQGKFMSLVYTWMASGLAITGIVAMFVANSEGLTNLAQRGMIFFFIAEIGLVFYISSRIDSMSPQKASIAFYTYSTLMGITLSSIFLIYSRASIASTFFVAAGTFATVSMYGYVTKKDLTSMGSFMMMGLIGIIIASVVNMFFQNSALMAVVNYLGVFIFVGLTAYDTQKIKNMGLAGGHGYQISSNKPILGALILYLDFINLFLFLLRILNSRD